MDQITESISDFAARLAYADLSIEAVHDCKRWTINIIGCL
jgi:hypothetical protein